MSDDPADELWVSWTRDPDNRTLVALPMVRVPTTDFWLVLNLYEPGPGSLPDGVGGFPFETPAGTTWARVHGYVDPEGFGTAVFTNSAGEPVAVRTWHPDDGCAEDSIRDRHLMGLGEAMARSFGLRDGLVTLLAGRIAVCPIYPTDAEWATGWSAALEDIDSRFFEAIGAATALATLARKPLAAAHP
jgi:hypothetical protein